MNHFTGEWWPAGQRGDTAARFFRKTLQFSDTSVSVFTKGIFHRDSKILHLFRVFLAHFFETLAASDFSEYVLKFVAFFGISERLT